MEFDSYTAQFVISLRVTSPEEQSTMRPAINSKLRAHDFLTPCVKNPDPVELDFTVVPDVLGCGKYTTACLQMAKIGKYNYHTVFTNSALDSFLSTEYGKLASYRKGLRWALMTST
eukprot:699840-Heterocapsa_arctica.AAC.1